MEISTEIDGVTVRGRIIEREPWDIEVEILEPYRGLTESLHTPYFARGSLPSYDDQQRFEKTAHWLLAELYRKAKTLHEHLPQLRQAWSEMHAKLRELERDDPDRPSVIAAERREARARFRSAGIDTPETQRQYQTLLTALKKREDAYRERSDKIIEDTIEAPPWTEGVEFKQLEPFMKAYAGE